MIKLGGPIFKSILITLFYYLLLNGILTLLFSYLSLDFIDSDINIQLINLGVNFLIGIVAIYLFKRFNKLSKEKFNVQLDYLALTILTITLTRVFIDPIYRFDQIIGN
ncbi:hypothetical protein J8281_18725, partial [Aquimarina sp. U1-2]|uniref:hypothetical protein n=1 Tax=Aquimarina sp. U1-2 TaxID=2823141 RepID=UPI001AECF60F